MTFSSFSNSPAIPATPRLNPVAELIDQDKLRPAIGIMHFHAVDHPDMGSRLAVDLSLNLIKLLPHEIGVVRIPDSELVKKVNRDLHIGAEEVARQYKVPLIVWGEILSFGDQYVVSFHLSHSSVKVSQYREYARLNFPLMALTSDYAEYLSHQKKIDVLTSDKNGNLAKIEVNFEDNMNFIASEYDKQTNQLKGIITDHLTKSGEYKNVVLEIPKLPEGLQGLVHLLAGMTSYYLERYEKSIDYLNQYLAQKNWRDNRTDGISHTYLAESHLGLGALKLEPKEESTTILTKEANNTLRLVVEQERFENVLNDYEKAIKVSPYLETPYQGYDRTFKILLNIQMLRNYLRTGDFHAARKQTLDKIRENERSIKASSSYPENGRQKVLALMTASKQFLKGCRLVPKEKADGRNINCPFNTN
ncbi:hypothetical protein [Candidatus Nitronereus thalassa]|uniref:Tetratricopeptide repeat protein n=1 Tax=Candidatus Nitronereus thalassa TaxID=3020898 RepID=A0ABU3K780_9BACT|nr:hypothetical protein [Candidatus Nitronereus thalassa]MDT7042219.1 hypothetical protein [Candidatus Nitronereus thalassa]